MILPKLFYHELKKINHDTPEPMRIKKDVIHNRRDKSEILKSNKYSDGIIRPRFKRLNTPMGPSRFIPLSSLREVEDSEPYEGMHRFAPDADLIPEPSQDYLRSQNLKESNINELKSKVDEIAEENSLTLEEAAKLLEDTYGPEKIFVWLVKILVFNGFMIGTLGFAMSFPTTNRSLPSFTLWAACTVVFSSFVSLFGCIFIAFARRVVEIRTATFTNAINSGLSVVTSLTVLWFFYGLLTIGKRDSPSVINNLAKLLWPLTFPMQGTPFVFGASFLILLFILFLVTSYKSTPINGSNRMFFNHGFLFMTAFIKALVQILANRGYVVCDMRSNPWASNEGTVYSFWNRTYAIWVTVNSLLAISFVMSLMGDLRIDRKWSSGKYIPYARIAHCAFIAVSFLAFMLFDITSSQGKNDIIDSNTVQGTTSKKEKAFHTLFNLGILGFCGVVAIMEVDWFEIVLNPERKNKEQIRSMQMEYKKEL